MMPFPSWLLCPFESNVAEVKHGLVCLVLRNIRWTVISGACVGDNVGRVGLHASKTLDCNTD